MRSASFGISNGVRQGGPLSPYLFRVYIRSLITRISNCNRGCYIGRVCMNILAFADDIVLLAPSWHAMCELLELLDLSATDIGMSINTSKTVCMIFPPYSRKRRLDCSFNKFHIRGHAIEFVEYFKHLGHIIENNLSDKKDIEREIRLMFMRTNILKSRFHRCSVTVKLRLFRSFCLCLYDVALWCHYSTTTINRLSSVYHKCIKYFFGLSKFCSVTEMFLNLGLPTMNTILHNSHVLFYRRLRNTQTEIVDCFIR